MLRSGHIVDNYNEAKNEEKQDDDDADVLWRLRRVLKKCKSTIDDDEKCQKVCKLTERLTARY